MTMDGSSRVRSVCAGLLLAAAVPIAAVAAEGGPDSAAVQAMVDALGTAVPNIDDGYCRATYPAFAQRQKALLANPLLARFNRVVRAHAIGPPAIDFETRDRQPGEPACLQGLDAVVEVLERHQALLERLDTEAGAAPPR
jgi:hypothetical protein